MFELIFFFTLRWHSTEIKRFRRLEQQEVDKLICLMVNRIVLITFRVACDVILKNSDINTN